MSDVLEHGMQTILVVDDDQKIRSLLEKFLTDKGYRVVTAASASEARAQIACHKLDLLILDVMMPSEDGFAFIQTFRNNHTTPVIFLTARDDIHDRIAGLDLGGDDYMAKPFDPAELVARMRSHLRRRNPSVDKGTYIHFGDIIFDKESGIMSRQDAVIPLSSTEVILLKILCQNPQQPLSRDELSQRTGFRVSARTIDVQITRLRRKMESDIRNPKFIRTVRHVGYALHPDKNP